MVKLSKNSSLTQDDLDLASGYSLNQDLRKRQTTPKQSAAEKDTMSGTTKRSKPVKKSKAQILIGYTILGLLSLGGFIKVFKVIHDIIYDPITQISINNENKIKDIMFGGDPWLVVCNDHSHYKNIERKLLKSKSIIDKYARIAAIPCNDKLPSGKLFCERFNFHPNTPGFIVPNGQNQKLLTIKTLLNETKLERSLASNTKIEIHQLSKISYFKDNCLDKKGTCVLIGQKSTPEKSFLDEYLPNCVGRGRKNKIIHLDTKTFQIKFDDASKKKARESMNNYTKESNLKALCLVNTQKGAKNSEKTSERYYIKYFKGNINEQEAFKTFVEECQDALDKKELEDFIALMAPPEMKMKSLKEKATKTLKEKIQENAENSIPKDKIETDETEAEDEIHITF